MEISASNQMKVIFILHFLLASWGIQGYWTPDSYLFYNLIFLLTLMWSMHCKDNAEPLQTAIAVNVVSMLLDVIVLSVYFPSSDGGRERFSSGMAIINLVARPFSTIVMSRNCSQRLGLDTDNFSNIFGNAPAGSRAHYDDIDRPGPS